MGRSLEEEVVLFRSLQVGLSVVVGMGERIVLRDVEVDERCGVAGRDVPGMGCLGLSARLFQEGTLQFNSGGECEGLRMLCEVSLIYIAPDLFHLSGFLQGAVLLLHEMELSLN